MNQESLTHAVQYKFSNEERYGKNGKSRDFKQISPDASKENLRSVGEALASLQGDSLSNIYLIDKKELV